jgi:hypothetical protein
MTGNNSRAHPVNHICIKTGSARSRLLQWVARALFTPAFVTIADNACGVSGMTAKARQGRASGEAYN